MKNKTEGTRRIPKQARSRERYESILNAAADRFAEQGFERTTMEEIAANAGTSIGAVYQFFSNKTAVFQAVAARCIEAGENAFAELVPSFVQKPWQEALDSAIEAFFRFQEENRDFRALTVNWHLYSLYEGSDRAFHDSVVAVTESLIAAHVASLPRAKRTLMATMLFEVIITMLMWAGRESKSLARKMGNETKIMLTRYLEHYAEKE